MMMLFTRYPSWISPEIIPGLPFRWYGMMYVCAFLTAFLLVKKEMKQGFLSLDNDQVENLFISAIIGLLLGARLLSVLVYNGTSYYWTHPWLIFWPFENGSFVGLPGMSYHGGLIGAILGVWGWCKHNKMEFFHVADALVFAAPLGYTFGRMGNFINGELYGRVTSSPFGMIFPGAERFSINYEWVRQLAERLAIPYSTGTLVNLPRHPSQLYEALFEGVLLFLFLWFVIKPRIAKHFAGFGLSWYIIGYGVVRFVIEYFREPDENLGFILKFGSNDANPALEHPLLNLSLGQIFCLAMIIAGILLYVILHHKKEVYTHDNK